MLFIIAFFIWMGYGVWQIAIQLFPKLLTINIFKYYPVTGWVIGAIVFYILCVMVSGVGKEN